MSRLTTSQLIQQGDYLQEGFDPSRLTIAQLNGLLGYHNVVAEGRDKNSLVRAFQSNISPQKKRLSKEHAARNSSKASSDGIVDGMSGKLLGRPRKSYNPDELEEEAPPAPRGRAKLVPRKHMEYTEPIKSGDDDNEVASDSEPEDEPPRRSTSVSSRRGSKGRRLSAIDDKRVSDDDSEASGEGNWSTAVNPFQQGGDSSSPTRESSRRKSRISAPGGRELVRVPGSAIRRSLAPVPVSRTSSPEPSPPPTANVSRRSARYSIQPSQTQRDYEEKALEELDAAETYSPFSGESDYDEQTLISRRLAGGGAIVRSQQPTFFSPGRIFLFSLFAMFLGLGLGRFKNDTFNVGFCNAGSNTNDRIEAIKLDQHDQLECSRRIARARALAKQEEAVNPGAAFDQEWDCDPLPIVPFPRMLACTPCPENAEACDGHNATCRAGFRMRRHALDNIPFMSRLFDGLPGFGPVAFPPSCVVDFHRENVIGKVGRGIEMLLAVERGERVCNGVLSTDANHNDGGEAKLWGVSMDELRKRIKLRMPNTSDGEFYGLFQDAITKLEKHSLVISKSDASGSKYVAAKRDQTNLSCAVRIHARDTWKQWRAAVVAAILSILAAMYGRRKLVFRAQEKAEVARLVQTSLDTLRNQEVGYNADPASVRAPYLSPAQLRDWVLQDEHSVSARKRLWKQVERVVEGNANVRTNVEEVDGGEETRVWKWVGASQAPVQHTRMLRPPRPIA
ncbi:Man1-Src1p-C-terminal domain-containing protein [Auriculariales sp. MPI-PUGE-AT-0066]|nr:Man1-Src1p-C-terminal domain-containing protein [Auriculariales sp. MPI-PUGE-AT-0066]